MQTRRQTLKHSAVVAGLLTSISLFSRAALAYNQGAFNAKSVADVLKTLGAGAPVESPDVTLVGPEIAENGAVVPFTIRTALTGVKHLLLLVEKNPTILIAKFNLTDRVEPSFAIRAKMGQTSDVYAVAIMNNGPARFAKMEVKVTMDGCGG